jgi:hypothetical protein
VCWAAVERMKCVSGATQMWVMRNLTFRLHLHLEIWHMRLRFHLHLYVNLDFRLQVPRESQDRIR